MTPLSVSFKLRTRKETTHTHTPLSIHPTPSSELSCSNISFMLTCWTSLRMEYALWICRLLSFPSGIFCRSIWWRFKQLKQDFTTLKPLQHSQMWIGYKVLHIHCWKTKRNKVKRDVLAIDLFHMVLLLLYWWILREFHICVKCLHN